MVQKLNKKQNIKQETSQKNARVMLILFNNCISMTWPKPRHVKTDSIA